MTRARSAWLVRLYPAGWRKRYEDEFVAMLEDARPSWTNYADILLGALDARLFLRDATGRTVTVGSAFAPTSQPNRSQKPQ